MSMYKFMGGVYDALYGEEEPEEDYDPHEHRKVPKPTSYMDTMIHLLKGSVGAGILAMPCAFGRVGLVFGLVFVIVICIFATYCIHILIGIQYELCKRHKRGYMAYPKSMRLALMDGPSCSRWAATITGHFVNIVLVVWQLGLCCVYTVFVAENIKHVCDFYEAEFDIRLHICFIFLPLVLVNLVKELKLLTPLSTISNGVTIMGLIITFFYLIEDDLDWDKEKFYMKDFEGVPVFIGITLFALEAVGVVLALEYNMAEPKRFLGWFGLFNIGMFIILILYALVGVFGYLKYGDDIEASITLNLPEEEKKAQAARIMIAFAIFLTHPLQNFVAYSIIMAKVRKRDLPPGKLVALDYFLRFLLVLLPWLVAVAVPTLGPFISLFGAFCLSLLAIIFPAVMDLCFWYPDQYGMCMYKLLRDILIIIVGIFCLCAGCYTSIIEIVETLTEEPEKPTTTTTSTTSTTTTKKPA